MPTWPDFDFIVIGSGFGGCAARLVAGASAAAVAAAEKTGIARQVAIVSGGNLDGKELMRIISPA